MRAGREASDYLADIFDAARQAVEFVGGLDYEGFLADRKTQFAVVRALEVVGEAASKVPEAERELLPHMPWRQMTAMRNKLIHDYFGVDPEQRSCGRRRRTICPRYSGSWAEPE